MKKPVNPNFNTPQSDLSKEELNKIVSNGGRGQLFEHFRDQTPDLIWESEQLAKSQGIYLEFNRATTGDQKDWMFMIRISIPGGGPITRKQWMLFDELSEKYCVDTDGHPSIRLTNRQNVQFHWVKKPALVEIIKLIAESGYNSLNGCGDNTRNVMACPFSRFSKDYNAHAWAQKAADYFQLPIEPFIEIFAIDPKYVRKPNQSFAYGKQLLNRKFKIAFSAAHPDPTTGKLVVDNCVEALTNDMSVVPVIENNKVARFQIYIGGGQGERNGKPSLATIGQALCQVEESNLLKVMDAVVKVHMSYGDRQNRWFARLKFVVKKMGIDWYRQEVSKLLGSPLLPANPKLDYGARDLHFGWTTQPSNGLLTYGMFIENGRVIDNSPNGKLKTMIRDLANKYPTELMITPNQDLLFTNIPPASKDEFEKDLLKYGYGKRNGKEYSSLRLHSGACVGRDTCRLTYTDSEKFEPFLIDELEGMGWGYLKESIGITGCERQCFRPATKSIGLVGSGVDRYQFKLLGDESGRYQGKPLMTPDGEQMYLRSVPREKVAVVINALFTNHKNNSKKNESLGEFHRRIGAEELIKYLKENPATTEFMQKTMATDYVVE